MTKAPTESKSGQARERLIRLLRISLMAAATAVCAWITVPSAVPFTLQTFAVFLTLVLLGGKDGTFSVLLYIGIGAAGLPVFSGFKGGVGVLTGPTGGYIFGFLVIGLLYWLVTALYKGTDGTKKRVFEIGALAGGLLLCYLFGTVWFLTATGGWQAENGIGKALMLCVVPFLIPDALKLALAYVIGDRVGAALNGKKKTGPENGSPSESKEP